MRTQGKGGLGPQTQTAAPFTGQGQPSLLTRGRVPVAFSNWRLSGAAVGRAQPEGGPSSSAHELLGRWHPCLTPARLRQESRRLRPAGQWVRAAVTCRVDRYAYMQTALGDRPPEQAQSGRWEEAAPVAAKGSGPRWVCPQRLPAQVQERCGQGPLWRWSKNRSQEVLKLKHLTSDRDGSQSLRGPTYRARPRVCQPHAHTPPQPHPTKGLLTFSSARFTHSAQWQLQSHCEDKSAGGEERLPLPWGRDQGSGCP